jgi:hypothetical protein
VRRAVVALLLGALGACRSSGGLDPRLYFESRTQAEKQGRRADVVRVTFLGTQGFLLERGEQSVLTAPLYSNPPLEKVLGGDPLVVDEALIDSRLPGEWVGRTSAILVGHSHYDHLMDVPYVMRTKAPLAVVYGSRTVMHLIAPAVADPHRLRSVSAQVDYRMCPGLATCEAHDDGQAGEWIPVAGDASSGPAIRVRALCSEHSPQFAGIGPLWRGCLHEDRSTLPETAEEWVLGDTLAWLLDFLQDGRPVFRVYFQDSPTDPTLGYVHPALLREKDVDVAILCAGAFAEVRNNPEGILTNTRPRYVLLGHWDDFLRSAREPLRSLPAHDFARLSAQVSSTLGTTIDEGRFWFPAPGASFHFAVTR